MKDSAVATPIDLSGFLPFQMAIVSGRLFQRLIADAGLQLPEWRIMMVLPRHEPCSSNDLSILTSMDAARVSRAQRRLESLNLIRVVQDQEDRRRLVVTLTEDGRDEARRLTDIARMAEDRLLVGLDSGARDDLRMAMTSLFARL
ncbi:MarR family transcriptional regulator [Rhodobacterales bacterium HKCCE3408]|nr:MarR family transcriptional regulator [Rhodobacterales bacterium HKCCE3408]